MNKRNFQENTRYAITLKDENGRMRPANIYVYKLHDDFMVVRFTDKSGMLHKVAYDDVTKIVKTTEVAPEARFMVPDVLLSAKTWQSRTSMQAYSSSPRVGK